jgi:hypothetical protein
MTIDVIIRTIQLMLAPVVMVTACSTYITMLADHYEHIVSSIRSMSREQFTLVQATGRSGTSTSQSRSDPASEERLLEIENELPSLLQRHGFIRNVLLCINGSIVIFIASMFVIAVAEFSNTLPGAFVALLIFLAGVGMVLIGVMQVIRENSLSHRDVVYEALRSLQFGR